MIQPKVVVQISLILNNVIGNLEKTVLYKGKITKIAGPSFLGVGEAYQRNGYRMFTH